MSCEWRMDMERGKLGVNLKWKSKVEGTDEGFKLNGKVVSKTRVGIGTVRDSVSAAWRVEGEWDVKMIGFNLFTFTFKVEDEANRILKENPWVVRNYMLSLQKRKLFLSDNEIQINTCEFWVQFHNIPPEGRMAANIKLMAGLVGRVITVEDPEEKAFMNRSFGRARIEVDIDKPLIPGFSAPRLDVNLEDVWIQAKYEKLTRFCFNCGKLGHESKGCEEDAVEFMVNGTLKGYDAGLCTQAFRLPATSKASWNQGRTAETGWMHGEGKSNKFSHGGVCTRDWCCGERGSNVKSRGEPRGQQSNQPKNAGGEGSMCAGKPNLGGPGAANFSHVEPNENMGNKNVGREWFTQYRKEEPMLINSGWNFNDTVGINSLLKARREKLIKSQSKYWVELVDEEDEGPHVSDAIIPIQNRAVGELVQGFREVSLKRKFTEDDESPPSKRKKDHSQDSPRSACERERAIAELQAIAESDGSRKFNYNYEGNLCFCVGDGSKEQIRPRKKVKRGLFTNSGSDYQLVVRAEAFRHREDAELYHSQDYEGNLDGHGGWPETATRTP